MSKVRYPNKEVRELILFAEANGFTVERGKHLKRNGKTVSAALTPSCPFAPMKARKDLEKAMRDDIPSKPDKGQHQQQNRTDSCQHH